MYAVIFRATFGELDQEYENLGPELRKIAEAEYGCIDFVAVATASEEISISYWPDLENIQAWKNDARHQAAMAKGRAKWYRGFSIQVVEVLNRREG
ncbi:MAG: antibiotic biosynthesis monooxygenase [Planctomycetes bacterium]|nr:antibiotic biosynthesis monooxygenase [Planctomycetota bacterium]